MKKPANADIKNLFNKFGGDTGNYQEIQQDYVIEKAQQSWPIVKAIEKAHAAAPKLRSSGVASRTHSGVHPAPHGSQAKADHSPSSVLKPLDPPVSSLFGSLAAADKPVQIDKAPVKAPLLSLFSAFNGTSAPASAPVAQKPKSENDPLDTVFSRLLNPQIPETVSSSEKKLRNLFGYLNKQ